MGEQMATSVNLVKVKVSIGGGSRGSRQDFFAKFLLLLPPSFVLFGLVGVALLGLSVVEGVGEEVDVVDAVGHFGGDGGGEDGLGGGLHGREVLDVSLGGRGLWGMGSGGGKRRCRWGRCDILKERKNCHRHPQWLGVFNWLKKTKQTQQGCQDSVVKIHQLFSLNKRKYTSHFLVENWG